MLRGIYEPKRVVLGCASVNIFGVDQPKPEDDKKQKSDRKTVATEKHFGGLCRISREDHWQIVLMKPHAASSSGFTLHIFPCVSTFASRSLPASVRASNSNDTGVLRALAGRTAGPDGPDGEDAITK
jgi:hypothetical protein